MQIPSKAKQIISSKLNLKGIDVKSIFLFGSRARNVASQESDWDFMVVINQKLSFSKKWDIIDEIKREMAKNRIPNDILIKSQEEFDLDYSTVGTFANTVACEGIPL